MGYDGIMTDCQKLRRLRRASGYTACSTCMPEVTECYNISGHFDYMLKINSFDMKQYQQFLINVLGRIESVASIESTFVMEEVKHHYGVNVIKEETAVP